MTLSHQIWACEKAALVDYLSRREQFDASSIDAEVKASLFDLLEDQRSSSILSIEDGVATVRIEGVLSKDGPDLFDLLFGYGGTSYTEIERAVTEAAADADVRQIRLEIDSPGGGVTGVDEARGAIARAAEQKELVAVNTGTMASAAYWLASAAKEIVSTSPTNMTGSIGVVAVAIDRTERDRKWGVVTIVSRNAPDKRPNLQTEAGRAVIQDQVDALERAFVERISEGRGISAEQVRKDFGRGRVMVASDPDNSKPTALSVGMIDRVINGFASGSKVRTSAEDAASAATLDHSKEAAALAAKTQEEPPCAAEGEQMSEELKAKIAELEKQLGGTRAAQDELSARMSAVAPILASDAYPAVIKEIAARVLAGSEHVKALEGAVAVHDAQHAQSELGTATEATEAAPAPAPKAMGTGVPEDGSIVSAESLEAQVKMMRDALGKE